MKINTNADDLDLLDDETCVLVGAAASEFRIQNPLLEIVRSRHPKGTQAPKSENKP